MKRRFQADPTDEDAASNIRVVESMRTNVRSISTVPSDDESAPVIFMIPPVAGCMMATDFYIHLQVKVFKKQSGDQLDILKSDRIGLANNPIGSLFKTADVEVRGRSISAASTSYPYVSYLRTMLEYDWDGRRHALASSHWFEETPLYHDNFNDDNDTFSLKENAIIDGQTVDLYGPIMLDICNLRAPLPDDVGIRITLARSPASFALTGYRPDDGTTYHIEILKADISFTRLRMAPGQDLYAKVGNGLRISYPMTRYETRHFVITGKAMSINQEIITSGEIPDRLFIGMLSQGAFLGSYSRNPYNFDHFTLETAFLRKNQTTALPSERYTTKLAKVYTRHKGYEFVDPEEPEEEEEAKEKSTSRRMKRNVKEPAPIPPAGPTPPPGSNKTPAPNADAQSSSQTQGASGSSSAQPNTSETTPSATEPQSRPTPTTPKPAKGRPPGSKKASANPGSSGQQPPPNVKLVTNKVERWSLKEYARLFTESLRVLDGAGANNRINLAITPELFVGGFFILAWDLRADTMQADEEQMQPPEIGTLSFEATFHREIQDPIVLLCISQHRRTLNIPAGGGEVNLS